MAGSKDPTRYDNPDYATVIAEASSRSALRDEAGLGQRWTEMRVFFVHNPFPGDEKLFVARIDGRSTVEGDDQKCFLSRKSTLEDALSAINDTFMGRNVKDQARDWLMRNSSIVVRTHAKQLGRAPANDLGDAADEVEKWLDDSSLQSPFPEQAMRQLLEHARKETARG